MGRYYHERNTKTVKRPTGRRIPEPEAVLYLQPCILRKTDGVQAKRKKAVIQNFRSGKIRIRQQSGRTF